MELLNTISNNRLWHKHGLQATWVVALLCLVVAIGKIGWTIYNQSSIKQNNYQHQAIAPLNQGTQQSYRIGDVVAANLFGDPKPRVVVTKAPKTTLDLTLQGILWASDEQFARAIIQSGKKKTELYSIGEAIKGAGVTIKEIRDDEVLLNRNGATESLPLVKKTSSGNRQIITFTSSTNDQAFSANAAPLNATTRQASLRSARKARAANGKPRKIRKPNFSGLDRALKKVGEI